MAWALLPTNYTDAVWSGLRKYSQVDNSDGTVSFQDVTVYTNKEKSFFGARDANRMNEALNYIMSMLENGTDLYEEFQTYFATQQQLFESSSNKVIENVRTLTNAEYDSYRTYIVNLKKEGDSSLAAIEQTYEEHMTTYESEQKASFDTWFAAIKTSYPKMWLVAYRIRLPRLTSGWHSSNTWLYRTSLQLLLSWTIAVRFSLMIWALQS